MKKILAASAIVASVCLLGVTAFAKEEAKADAGETLFKQHCAVCHPDGGNIINPKKTLHKKDREANGVKKAEDIVGKMRNPGPGMTKFDKKTISDKEAKEIAEYVLKALQ
jgi:cytochrome c6